MNRKIALWTIWAGFLVYVLFLAPPIHWQETLNLLMKILTFQWTSVNPVILSLFALIGVCIALYSCVLFFDGRMQKLPFYPFAIASVGTGVIGLIPYLALREANQEFTGQKDAFLQLLDSRITGLFLTLFTLALLGFGIIFGDWGNYLQQFLSDRFINGMSLAFCLFCLLFPTVLGDDMARRGYLSNSQLFWMIALVPLLGPLAYLCWRPPIKSVTSDQ
ncbi:hypothetical protein H6G17_18440 [Chroococcidiopsis sp. FACHB-1243]|uniref:hypothetical protein n=1 Tax=Chroococcidiopsis sp. [FACHB-1243] TaxID=2692781 RepID=UPI00178312C1|nr:hypothetical protein [Chroococcidiopsis sp. [FACHB-1243]]MBD2307456.1 hypothetical protein [Chroococcidiopsis sp. [FACHB-1243]]